jgi:hypothetical protein
MTVLLVNILGLYEKEDFVSTEQYFIDLMLVVQKINKLDCILSIFSLIVKNKTCDEKKICL